MKTFRPFELLKFFRDGQFHDTSNDGRILLSDNSRLHAQYGDFIKGLKRLDLIKESMETGVVITENFTLLLKALNISLTQLETYSEDSVICDPLFGLPSNKSEKSTDIFMVMPFLESLKPVYDDHIRNVAKKMKLTIARGDDFFTTQSIISDIWNAIYSCKIVIADCTGRNPNVFYEIGMAHTLGKPVVLISQDKNDIPFDVQHIRYIVYEFTPRGMSDFEERLKSAIKHILSELASDDDRLILEEREHRVQELKKIKNA